jgi:hypothetical protein
VPPLGPKEVPAADEKCENGEGEERARSVQCQLRVAYPQRLIASKLWSKHGPLDVADDPVGTARQPSQHESWKRIRQCGGLKRMALRSQREIKELQVF